MRSITAQAFDSFFDRVAPAIGPSPLARSALPAGPGRAAALLALALGLAAPTALAQRPREGGGPLLPPTVHSARPDRVSLLPGGSPQTILLQGERLDRVDVVYVVESTHSTEHAGIEATLGTPSRDGTSLPVTLRAGSVSPPAAELRLSLRTDAASLPVDAVRVDVRPRASAIHFPSAGSSATGRGAPNVAITPSPDGPVPVPYPSRGGEDSKDGGTVKPTDRELRRVAALIQRGAKERRILRRWTRMLDGYASRVRSSGGRPMDPGVLTLQVIAMGWTPLRKNVNATIPAGDGEPCEEQGAVVAATTRTLDGALTGGSGDVQTVGDAFDDLSEATEECADAIARRRDPDPRKIQKALQEISKTISMMTNVMRAAHDVAKASIHNIR